MPDPLSRLQLAHDEINKTFGVGFAEQHPELVVVVVQSAASDWAAARVVLGGSPNGELTASPSRASLSRIPSRGGWWQRPVSK